MKPLPRDARFTELAPGDVTLDLEERSFCLAACSRVVVDVSEDAGAVWILPGSGTLIRHSSETRVWKTDEL